MDPHAAPALLRHYRRRLVAVGIHATLLTVAIGTVYLLLPGSPANPLLGALIAVAALSALLFRLMPWDRIVESPHVLRTFYAWTGGDIVLIGFAIAATGGAESDLHLMYVVTTIFFGALYPPRGQLALYLLTVASYVGVLALTGWGITPAALLVRLSTIGVLAYIGGFISRELMQQMLAHVDARARLAHHAYHDALTGLPNRPAFFERLEEAVGRAREHGHAIAVLFLDLDGFKVVNDSLGHDAGDELLVQVADRLRSALRPDDVIARLGGDEFTVLLERLDSEADATSVAERLIGVLEPPVAIRGRDIFVTTSVGIVIAEAGRQAPGDMLRDADLAMYLAKERGRARFEVYDAHTARGVLDRHELEASLRGAVERDEFVVHYQPEVTVHGGRLVGFEALVRWRHPVRGLLPPAEFIAFAESTGLILPIGRRVLQEACALARRWADETDDPAPMMSVNLSPQWVLHPGMVPEIRAILDETGLPPGLLQVEITERVAMTDAEQATAALRALKDLGVRLAIDDFGTGYSSLSYLKHLPVDVVKLDRTFIAGLGASRKDTAIVSAVVTLAHALGKTVTAEGVETKEQLAILAELGCDTAQGFYFERPRPADEARTLLRAPLATWARGARG